MNVSTKATLEFIKGDNFLMSTCAGKDADTICATVSSYNEDGVLSWNVIDGTNWELVAKELQ